MLVLTVTTPTNAAPAPARTLGEHIRSHPNLYNAHLVRGMLVSLRELVAIDRARAPTTPSVSMALEIAVTRAVHLGYQAYLSASAADAHAPPPSARLSAAEFAEVLELTVRLAYERFHEEEPAPKRPRPASAVPPTLDVEIPHSAALLDDDSRALRYLADGRGVAVGETTAGGLGDDAFEPHCSCFHDRG